MLNDVNLVQYEKARELVENQDIKISRAYEDRIIFEVNGENGDYTLGFDPKTRESLCQCKAEHFNNGNCYHKIAAIHLLAREA
jgi:hypothetical protein